MKLENQVCTFEQAMQFRKLGLSACSYYKWYVGKLDRKWVPAGPI